MSLTNENKKRILASKKNADTHFSNYLLFYSRDNLSKASELLWGTINALFYAIGIYYGRKLGDYSKIRAFLPEIIQAYNDETIIKEGFESATVLHANFYQNFMDKESFEYHRINTEKLIEKLNDIYTGLTINED